MNNYRRNNINKKQINFVSVFEAKLKKRTIEIIFFIIIRK